MNYVIIKAVKINKNNALQIFPELTKESDYIHIYRDASGVCWDIQQKCLNAREPERWNHWNIYKQIQYAVKSEYGDSLIINSDTVFDNIPNELKKKIQQESSNV